MMNGVNTLIVSWMYLYVNKLRDKLVEEVGRGQASSFLLDLLCVFCSQSLFRRKNNTLSAKYIGISPIYIYSL